MIAIQVTAGTVVADSEIAIAVRTLCHLLGNKHPGKTLEVRVPPFAAVQVGSAARGAHTRGTPGNVVETNPHTFLALAIGGLSWEQALEQHLVHASGTHTDLCTWFPLLSADDAG